MEGCGGGGGLGGGGTGRIQKNRKSRNFNDTIADALGVEGGEWGWRGGVGVGVQVK